MKKIIALIFTVIILFSCVSCFKSDQYYSYSFKTQEEFASIMKKDITRYDEDFDFHFYKWGDNMPETMHINAQTSGSVFKPIITFDAISLLLTNVDENFGTITIWCSIADDEKFFKTSLTCEDFVVNGYAIKYSRGDENEIESFCAYYIAENYVVEFALYRDKKNLIDKGYTRDDFLSCLPVILESKQQLKL